jgi:hypothetical protein
MSGTTPRSPVLPRSLPGLLLACSKNSMTSLKISPLGSSSNSTSVVNSKTSLSPASAGSIFTAARLSSFSSKEYSISVCRSPSCLSRRACLIFKAAPVLPVRGRTKARMSAATASTHLRHRPKGAGALLGRQPRSPTARLTLIRQGRRGITDCNAPPYGAVTGAWHLLGRSLYISRLRSRPKDPQGRL